MKTNYSLYLNHKVQLTLQNGECVHGILSSCHSDHLLLDDTVYPITDISDLRLIGILTDYHTFRQSGQINRRYSFDLQHCRPEDAEKIKYHEYSCTLSCHLIARKTRVQAVDIAVVEYTYIPNEKLLSESDFLYFLKDFTVQTGRLHTDDAGYALLSDGKADPIDISSIDSVTRLPVINDRLWVLQKDGSSSTGIVTAVKPSFFSVLSGPNFAEFTKIRYDEIDQLRYFGTITSLDAVIDRCFLFKTPHYLRDFSQSLYLRSGNEVSYVPSVNARGFIAKDVVIESRQINEDALEEHLGVILKVDTSKPNGIGYIGTHFSAKSQEIQESGNVLFYKNQMNFLYDYSQMICVVKYTTIPRKDLSSGRIVRTMELFRVYDYKKYSAVRILENQQIHAVSIFEATVDRYYKNKTVCLCLQDGRSLFGVLTDRDETGVFLQNDGNTSHTLFSEIDKVRLSGVVTDYRERTGRIDRYFFFHVDELLDPSEAKHIRKGSRLSFVLRNVRKGVGVDCTELQFLE